MYTSQEKVEWNLIFIFLMQDIIMFLFKFSFINDSTLWNMSWRLSDVNGVEKDPSWGYGIQSMSSQCHRYSATLKSYDDEKEEKYFCFAR